MAEQPQVVGIRLHCHHSAPRAGELRREQREIPDVGPHVEDRHTRLDGAPQPRALGRLPASMLADVGGHDLIAGMQQQLAGVRGCAHYRVHGRPVGGQLVNFRLPVKTDEPGPHLARDRVQVPMTQIGETTTQHNEWPGRERWAARHSTRTRPRASPAAHQPTRRGNPATGFAP
jgi:hypothetical protein